MYNDDFKVSFMFNLIIKLSRLGAPIVFKGAMVLKTLQVTIGNPSGLIRDTKDIDGDWVGDPPTMEFLYKLLCTAVRQMGYPSFDVKVTREWAEKRAAGFEISDGDKFTIGLDISIKHNPFSTTYIISDGVSFVGQTMDKIIADKIVTVTSRTVCRRIKDFIDLYILSFMYSGSFNQVIQVINMTGNQIGKGDTFRYHVDDMIHAYSKYKNSASRLDFNVLYPRVNAFVSVFIDNHNYIQPDMYWNVDRGWVR